MMTQVEKENMFKKAVDSKTPVRLGINGKITSAYYPVVGTNQGKVAVLRKDERTGNEHRVVLDLSEITEIIF